MSGMNFFSVLRLVSRAARFVLSLLLGFVSSMSLIPVANAFDANGFGPTFKVGYVYARGILLGEQGQPIFAEYDEEGEVIEVIGEAVDALRGARIMSANDYRIHHARFLDFKTEFGETKAKAARLMTREEYLRTDFGRVSLPNLQDPNGDPIETSIVKPPLPEGVASVLVRDEKTIVTEQIARNDLILFRSPIDLRAAGTELNGNNAFKNGNPRSLLLNEAGQIVYRSEVDIGLRTAYFERADGSHVDDPDEDDQRGRGAGDRAIAPIANALVYPDMQWNRTTRTDEEGQYTLYYFLPPCPGFTHFYDYHVVGEIPYRNFNPKTRNRIPWATYYVRTPVSDFCDGTAINLASSTNLIGQQVYNTLVGIHASRSTPIPLADIPVVSHLLTGLGAISNDGQSPVPLGERTAYGVTARDLTPIAPTGPDIDGDGVSDGIPDTAPDFRDQGLLKTLHPDDLDETDIYVYRLGNGQLLIERKGLNPEDAAAYTGQCSEANPDCLPEGAEPSNQFYYKVLVRGRWFQDFVAGSLPAYQTKTGVNPELNGLDVNHLRAGEALEVIAINRKTGYIGTATAVVEAASGVGSSHSGNGGLSIVVPPLVLAPPNLKIEAKRTFEVEAGLTKEEEREYTIGFEGAGLTTDKYIVITTEWFDHDGTPLPDDLPGYTGRLAHVIEQNELGAVSGRASQFAIDPGNRTQIIRLPTDSPLDREHYYIHVNGDSPEGNPDFSTGDQGAGAGPLKYRPQYYTPIRVPIFDESATREERNAVRQANEQGLTELEPDDVDAIYRWPYRPEMQFSVFDLEIDRIVGIEDPNDPDIQVIIYDPDSDTDCDADLETLLECLLLEQGLVEVLYDLLGNPNDPLPQIGGPRELILSLGGEEVIVTLGEDGRLVFEHLEHLADLLEVEDYLAIQLYLNSDVENVLWEFVFGNAPLSTDFTRTTHLGQFNAAQSTDGVLDLTDSFQVYKLEIDSPSDVKVEILDSDKAVVRTLIDETNVPPETYALVLTYEDIVELVETRNGVDFYLDITTVNQVNNDRKRIRYEGELKEDVASEMLGQVLQHDTLIQRGAVSLRREDIQLKGVGPQLSFIRSYSNESKRGNRNTMMGPGWNHNHDISVQVMVRGDATGLEGNNVPSWVEENRGQLVIESQLDDDDDAPLLVQVSNGGLFKKVDGAWYGQRGYHGRLSVQGGQFEYLSKDGTEYLFEPLNDSGSAKIQRITDPNGNRLTYEYSTDFEGRLLRKITDVSGRELNFTYTDIEGIGQRLTDVTSSNDVGIALEFEYHQSSTGAFLPENGLLSGFRRDDFTETYTYDFIQGDTVANLAAYTDSNGHVTGYDYFPENEVSPELAQFARGIAKTDVVESITYADGQEARIAYDMTSGSNKRTVTDLRGNSTTYTLNDFGNPLMVAEPEDRTTAMTWSIDEGKDDNLMTSRRDAEGRLTTYTYDTQGNLIEQVDPRGTLTQTFGLQYSRMLSRTDRNSHTTAYEYDAKANLIGETDAEGFETTHDVDSQGLRTASHHPGNGGTTTYSYDTYGNPRSTTLPEGSQFQSFHDPRGRLARQIDANGHDSDYQYDELDRLVRTVDRDGQVATMTYDRKGNKLSETNKLGLTLTYEYDPRDRVIEVTRNVGGGRKTYGYDSNSNLISETDWKGQITQHQYDDVNRRIVSTNRLDDDMLMEYDRVDNVIRETDYEGRVTEHEYDDGDRRIRSRNPLNDDRLYTYDNENNVLSETDYEGRLTQYEYDKRYLRTKRTNALNDDYLWAYDARQNLLSTTDEAGRLTTHVYDKQNRRIETTDAEDFVMTYEYDPNDNVIRHTDRRGETTITAYDELDRPIALTDPENFITRYSYDGLGNTLSETDGNGQIDTYEYDALSRATRMTNSVQAKTTYQYDENNNITQVTDPRGRITDSEYDALDRLIEETQAQGVTEERTRRFTYDKVDNLITGTNFRGFTTTTDYDDLDRPVKTTSTAPFSFVSTVSYDKVGNVIETKDRLNRITRTEYDDLNRPTQVTDPLNQAITRIYDPVGNILTETDKRGTQTTHLYDPLNRLIQSEKPALTAQIRLVLNEYDGEGLLIAQTDANNNRTENEYDGRGLLIQSTYADNTTMAYTLDGVGNILTDTDEISQVMTYAYDAENRLITKTNPAQETTAYAYDLNNNKTRQTRPLGNITTYAYDLHNRLTQITDDLGGITKYQYDGNNNPIEQIDANNNIVRMDYDELDRETRHIQEKQTGHLIMTYGYDAMNNRISMTDPKGQSFSYTYDDLDRETQRTYPNASNPVYLAPIQITTTYDPNNNPIQITEAKVDTQGIQITDITTMGYDLLDREIANTQRGHQVTYAYDDNGNKTGVATTQGDTAYGFDVRNRLITATKANQTSQYTYTGDSKVNTMTYPNGTKTTYSYDDADRTESVINENTTTTLIISSYQYVYDDNGNRTQQIEVQNSLTQTEQTTDYQYDRLDRLQSFTETKGNGDTKTATYQYDPAYNRIHESESQIESGITTITKNRSLSYDETHWLTQITSDDDPSKQITYQYDPNGNTLRKIDNTQTISTETHFTYNSRDQLVQTIRGPPQTEQLLGAYDYDYKGDRVRHTHSERGDIEYIYDGKAVLEERTLDTTTGNNTGSLIAHYQYADRLISLTSSTDQQYYHYQALRTTANLTDQSGNTQVSYRTDPWGQITEQAGISENRQVFTGQETDERTGLIYFGARYYDPDTARFLNQDTYLGENTTAPSLHRYLYAYGNPTVYIDLYGYAATLSPYGSEHLQDGNRFFGTSRLSEEEQDFAAASGEKVFDYGYSGAIIGGDTTAEVKQRIKSASDSENPALLVVEHEDTLDDLIGASLELLGQRFGEDELSVAELTAHLKDRKTGEYVDLTAFWNRATSMAIEANMTHSGREALDLDDYLERTAFLDDVQSHLAYPQIAAAGLVTVTVNIGNDESAPRLFSQAAREGVVEIAMEMLIPFAPKGLASAKRLGESARIATKGTGTGLIALGRAGIGRETFRAIGSLEGKSISEVSKTLSSFGFKFKSRTEGGFIKFVGPGTSRRRLEIQIRPNGQVIRSERFGRGRTRRFDSSGNVNQNHQNGEFLGGNFSGG